MGFQRVLNSIAVLMLVSAVSSAMRPMPADRCQTPPGPGTRSKEICSMESYVKNMIRRIRCMKPTIMWTVCSTNPMVLIPRTNTSKTGIKKTSRQFDAGKARAVCTIRCLPLRASADLTSVKKVKQTAQGQINNDSSRYLSDRNRGGQANGDPRIQEDIKKSKPEDIERSEPEDTEKFQPKDIENPEPEELCIPDDILIYRENPEHCKTSNSSGQKTNENDDECASDAVKTALCSKVEGVCPAMSVLMCLSSMQAGSEHGEGNVKALNNSQYANTSIKIDNAGNTGEKLQLTEEQMDQLKGITEYDIKAAMMFRGKPMVVQIEDTLTNKTLKYVIVKEVGNMMVGWPYDDSIINTTSTPRPHTTYHNAPPPQPGSTQPPSHRVSFMGPAQKLVGIPPFEQCLEPPPVAGYSGTQTPFATEQQQQQPYLGESGMTETSSPSGLTCQMTMEPPKTTQTVQLGPNQSYTDRSHLYNHQGRSSKSTANTGSWITEQILPDCDSYEYYEDFQNVPANSEPYNVKNGPQSYWNVKSNSKSNAPKSEQLYEVTRSINHNSESNDRFQMNSNYCNAKGFPQYSIPNSEPTTYSHPQSQMGNSIHQIMNQTPQKWSSVQQPMRLQPAKFPDNLITPPQNYNFGTTGYPLNPPQVFEIGEFRTEIPNRNQPTSYNNRPINSGLVASTEFQASGKQVYRSGQPTWGRNFQTDNGVYTGAQLQQTSSDSYCDPYNQRAYPKPTIGYPTPMYKSLEPTVQAPVGYTYPPTMKVC